MVSPLMSPLAGTKHTYVELAIAKFSHYFQGVELHNWDFLCDVRPDCQHHFDAERLQMRCLIVS